MTIVSEVGAVIVENGVRIFDTHFEKPVVEPVLEIFTSKRYHLNLVPLVVLKHFIMQKM